MTNCKVWNICDNVGKSCGHCEENEYFHAIAFNNVVIVNLLIRILTELERL